MYFFEPTLSRRIVASFALSSKKGYILTRYKFTICGFVTLQPCNSNHWKTAKVSTSVSPANATNAGERCSFFLRFLETLHSDQIDLAIEATSFRVWSSVVTGARLVLRKYFAFCANFPLVFAKTLRRIRVNCQRNNCTHLRVTLWSSSLTSVDYLLWEKRPCLQDLRDKIYGAHEEPENKT